MGYFGRISGINKMLKFLHLVVAVVLLNAACATSECAVNVPEAKARLGHGTVALTGKFLQYLVSTNPEENSVASAASLMIPLAQLTLWARDGPVLNELLKVLNLKCKNEIKEVFRELTAVFKNQSQVEFEVASKYYANEHYPLTNDFKSVSKVYFDAEGENLDFSQSEEAAETINAWVSNRTRGKIQDLVNAAMFNEATRLTLVNAIYFLGNWVNKFNPKDTAVRDFYKSNGETVPLQMMSQQNTFNYAENEKFQVLEMFYKGHNFSFVVILPRNKGDLLSTLETVSDPSEWNKILESLKPERVDVNLPKMLIKTNINLQPLLTKNGVGKMFDSDSNGFEGVLQNKQPVYITGAVQQAHIAVDETGTEAAAATAIIAGAGAFGIIPPPPKDFNADHPYLYFIMSNKTPVFSGAFVGAK